MKSRKSNGEINGEKANEMTFWEHLTELRSKLIRILLSVLVFSVIAFIYSRFIFDKIILAPKSSDFITYRWLCSLGRLLHVDSLCLPKMNLEIVNLNLSGQFMTDMYISIFAGIILATPYIFWQAWKFIKPALYEKEQRYARSAVFIMSGLFFLGVLFSYYFMVPWTLNFLGTYQVSDMVDNRIALNSYISTVVSVILSVGVVFELPVVVYVLAKIGIMSSSFLRKNRKYAFVIVLIVAAIITPPDVFSQIIVTMPLWLLYEVSILVAKRVEPKELTAESEEV
ncbi:MAG TPA: twin-arginine translocase subunit TatC [Bacteroidales bacterium]|nr:twin-arginine translocase subunit TatC [Bacteroidales bacterium]